MVLCTPKGSNQAPAYTSEFMGTPAISQETNRTINLRGAWIWLLKP
jgi:hypothetical protein